MTEDPTKDLTDGEKLNLILFELRELKTTAGALDARLTALEAQGVNITRPLLDQIIKEVIETREMLTERMDRMEGRLQHIESQLQNFKTKSLARWHGVNSMT